MTGSRRCYWKEPTPTNKLDARRWSSCPTSTWFTEYAVVYSRNVPNTLWTFICLATWTCLEIRMQCVTVECVYTMCVCLWACMCVCVRVCLCVCVCLRGSIYLLSLYWLYPANGQFKTDWCHKFMVFGTAKPSIWKTGLFHQSLQSVVA